tara:strand:+ start:1096 stop:1488 length:393 start_codon:yes stop_codon:yes gene_type:complete
MNILGTIFSSGATELVKSVGGVIDNLTTTDEERAEAKLKIEEMVGNLDIQMQKEVSARWTQDMNSDSWLSKNVRPLTLVFLTFIFVILSFFDGNVGGFEVSKEYIPVYQTLLMVVYGAYFAGRSIEKVKK